MLWRDYEGLCYNKVLEEQHEWTHTREICMWIYNTNRGKQAYKSAKQLYPLSIDNVNIEKVEISKEDHLHAIKVFSKFLN